MIDGSIFTILPPIVASVLTYVVAQKKARLSHIKTVAEIQTKAIELVQKAEESMRAELMKEIERIREENEELKKKINLLEEQRNASDRQANILKDEISTLREALNHYKKIVEDNKVSMEDNQKELDRLRQLSTQTGDKKTKKK